MEPTLRDRSTDGRSRGGSPPAGPGTRAAVARRWLVPGLLVALAAALALRGTDLGRRPLGPVEAVSMERALARGGPGGAADLGRAAGVLVEGVLEGDAHGACARAARHARGAGRFSDASALRLDGALLGSLAVLLVALSLLREAPFEPLTVLAGAGVAAVQLGAVEAARTGTGEAPAAALWFAALLVARRMQTGAGEDQWVRLVAGSAAVAGLAALGVAFDPRSGSLGWLLVGAGVLLFRRGPNGVVRWPWASRRVAAAALAAVPALVLAARLDPLPAAPTISAWTQLQLVGWPVLLLAPLGAAGAFTRDAGWALWLVLWAALPPLLLHGLRAPWAPPASLALSNLFAVVLCAEGLALLWGLARHRIACALADLAAIGSLLYLGAVTWASVHGVAANPWSVVLP